MAHLPNCKIEKNIIAVKSISENEKPGWIVTTNSTISKSCIKNLEEFAKWHVDHRIQTLFFDYHSERSKCHINEGL